MDLISDRKVSFTQSVPLFYNNFANFSGRSSRGAYWWWILASRIIAFSIAFCEAFSGGAYDYDNEFSVISTLFTLVNIIPTIALVTRRLHDVGRSGWWYLIVITVIGIIPFLYWVCKKGDTGPNKYGEDIEAGR